MDQNPLEFTSQQSKAEALAALVYLPIHVLVAPIILAWLMVSAGLSVANANFAAYSFAAVYMLITQWSFLRRDFDALCDRPFNTLMQVCICYGLMLCCNFCVNMLFSMILPQENPNSAAIIDMAGNEYNRVFAMSVFLAPIVEELIFRAGIFGTLRRRSRPLAYAVSMLAFALYHIWSYALIDPIYWIYLLQYLPVSYLLCRCYERTNTIWASMLMHAIINGVSMSVVSMAQELL